ncbi:MAG: ABC transporter ATP-binding protein [Chryseobacterium sp.]|nr:MAG: ABC transporter ATP-binding protein [Chryseobacterium sp.]
MEPAISVKNLAKQYGQMPVIRDISFDVPTGSVFAFLGTNGAGKSTTINCIVTTLQPTSGEIYVLGKKIGKDDAVIKQNIGVVFQSSILDPLLTVRENIKIRGSFYTGGVNFEDRIKELIDLIDMDEFIDRRYGMLSGGQKRRADIARALYHNPSILFLDEPTTGLDPKSRETVWQLIRELQKKQGKTVFLTTHYMEETENADNVVIIDKGTIVSTGTPQQLRSKYSQNILRLEAKDPDKLSTRLSRQKIFYKIVEGGVFVVHPPSSESALDILHSIKSDIIDFEFRHGNMDDVFLKLAEGADRL